MTPSQLALAGATIHFDGRAVLDAVDLTLRPGEHVGIVGDNGSGKTTLLSVIAGRLALDNGSRLVVAPGGIAYAAQALDLPEHATVQDAIDHVMADLRALEARLHDLEGRMRHDPAALAEYTEATAAFEALDGYQEAERVAIALAALGVPDLERERRFTTLSGGEQARVALAAALASNAELLLLDEPTNDLDDTAIAWLEERLRSHRGTVIAVTHDRVFLDRLTPVLLEVEAGQVRRYGDGYSGYLAAKEAERRRHLLAYEEWRSEILRHARLLEANAGRLAAIPQKMEKAGFGHGAFSPRDRGHGASGRIRNAKQRLARLAAESVARPADPLELGSPLVSDGGTVELSGVVVPGRLAIADLRIEAGERLLVTGANGAGKSSLLGVIAGEVPVADGSVERPASIGFLRQSARRWRPGVRLLDAFAEGRGVHPDDLADDFLALGLFRPADLNRPMADLSYGQQRRLELARVIAEPTDLLLLDEPTNHRSPALVEQLEEALVGYPGAVVTVTHDRRMRERFAGRRVTMRDGVIS